LFSADDDALSDVQAALGTRTPGTMAGGIRSAAGMKDSRKNYPAWNLRIRLQGAIAMRRSATVVKQRLMSRTHPVRIAAWFCLCFIIYAPLSPLRDRPILLIWSSAEHFAAFAVLGGFFYLAYPRRALVVLVVILGCAILLELLQLLTPDRHARIVD